MQLSRAIKLFVKIAISIAFFSVLLSFVQTNELAEVFKNINWVYMVITFGVTLIMVLASCAKWKVILDLKDKKIAFWQLFKIYLVGYFFSNILPSTVGGDVVRSYYAGKLINNQSFSAVAVFVERFSGIFFLFILVSIAPLAQPHLYKNPYIFFPACGGLFFAFIILWIWKAKNPFQLPDKMAGLCFRFLNVVAQKSKFSSFVKLVGFLERGYGTIIDRLGGVREELQVATQAIKENSTFLYRLIYLTVLFYLLTWVNVYTCFKAFNVEVEFVKICAIVPAIMLVAHIPVTLLGNLGYFESVFVFYFLMVGVGGAETLAMGLLLRIKMLAMGVLGFFTYLIYKQKNQLDIKSGTSSTN